MNIHLAFDKQGTDIEISDDINATVLEARYAAEVPDADAALAAAIAVPIGCPPLEDMARGKKSAARVLRAR